MSSTRISAHYTDEQLQTVRQTAEILRTSVEDLLRIASHPGIIADLESAEGSATAPNTSDNDRGVLAEVPTIHYLPQQVVPDGTPLLNHNVQNTDNTEKFQADDELFSDSVQNSVWLQQDAFASEAGPSTHHVREDDIADRALLLEHNTQDPDDGQAENGVSGPYLHEPTFFQQDMFSSEAGGRSTHSDRNKFRFNRALRLNLDTQSTQDLDYSQVYNGSSGSYLQGPQWLRPDNAFSEAQLEDNTNLSLDQQQHFDIPACVWLNDDFQLESYVASGPESHSGAYGNTLGNGSSASQDRTARGSSGPIDSGLKDQNHLEAQNISPHATTFGQSSRESSSDALKTYASMQLPRLAPRLSNRLAPEINAAIAQATQVKTKAARKPFQDTRVRKETADTRRNKACIRCRMQRVRVSTVLSAIDLVAEIPQCIPDPENPAGPCFSCRAATKSIFTLPCLRYKVSDSILFRTGLPFWAFYKNHPMVGKNYGDFHLEKSWTSSAPRVLEITQDRGTICRFEVREFLAPVEHTVDVKERPMYAIPWAMVDAESAMESINTYLEESIGPYLDTILDDSDPVVWNIFHAALRLSLFPEPVSQS